MADGFHIKDIDKLYQNCCQFLGKKITIKKTNYKHEIEKIYFMNIYIYIYIYIYILYIYIYIYIYI